VFLQLVTGRFGRANCLTEILITLSNASDLWINAVAGKTQTGSDELSANELVGKTQAKSSA